MADGTVQTEVEIYDGSYMIEVFGRAGLTCIEFFVSTFDKDTMGEVWASVDIYELTPAELDALIAALTKARALREPAENHAGGNGGAGDE